MNVQWPQQSKLHANTQSRLFARGQGVKDPFEVQSLLVVKQWPGMGITQYWPNPLSQWGYNPNPFPPVDYQTNFRKHFAGRSGQMGLHSLPGNPLPDLSYNFAMTIIGPGSCPVLTGMPGYIDPNTGQFDFSFLPYWRGLMTYPGGVDVPGGCLTGPFNDPQRLTFSGYEVVGPVGGLGYGGPWTEHSSENYPGDIPFAPILAACVGRLLVLNWGSGQYYSEVFDEFCYSTELTDAYRDSLNPGDYTGNPVVRSSLIQTLGSNEPYFGAGGTQATYSSLWLYPGNEWFNHTPSDAPYGPYVVGVRRRVKFGANATYFMAKARIVSIFHNALGYNTLNDLANVSLVAQGSGKKGQVIEIPLPHDDQDFAVTTDRAGNATLSNGQIQFLVLNETPAAWAARTGYPIH